MTKQLIHRLVTTLRVEDCSVDELLQILNDAKAKHPTEDLQIEYGDECGGYHGAEYMDICYTSEETDEEFHLRLEREREKQQQKELKEMDRLLGYKTLNSANQKRLDELLEKFHNG